MAVTRDCYVGESCIAYANDRVDSANDGVATQTFYLFIDGVEPGSTTFGISGSVFAL